MEYQSQFIGNSSLTLLNWGAGGAVASPEFSEF